VAVPHLAGSQLRDLTTLDVHAKDRDVGDRLAIESSKPELLKVPMEIVLFVRCYRSWRSVTF
jgi:hypothetical protein